MAKPGPGHQPLSWRDHVKLRAAHKHLHSPFPAVRAAAAREIQHILSRVKGVRPWLRRLRQAAVRKVTPKRLHGPLGVAREQAARKPGGGRDIPAGQWRKFTPMTDHTLTRRELRDRQRAARRGQPAQPQRSAPSSPSPGLEQDLAGVNARTAANLLREQQGDLRDAWQQASREGYEQGVQKARDGSPVRPDAQREAERRMRGLHQQPAARTGRDAGAAPAAAPAHDDAARRAHARQTRAERKAARAQEPDGGKRRWGRPQPAQQERQVFDRLPSGYKPEAPAPSRTHSRTA